MLMAGPQLGAASWSFAGWLTAFPGFGESTFIGTVYIVGAAVWSILSVYTLWCMKDVSGGSAYYDLIMKALTCPL
jgi:hypothetical protein